jgi:hypothetical protein
VASKPTVEVCIGQHDDQRSIIASLLNRLRHLALHEHKSDQKDRVDSEILAKSRERICRMTEFLLLHENSAKKAISSNFQYSARAASRLPAKTGERCHQLRMGVQLAKGMHAGLVIERQEIAISRKCGSLPSHP